MLFALLPSLHIVHQPYIKKQNPRSQPYLHLHANQLYIEKQIPHLKLRDEFWPRSYHVVPCFERVVFHRVANPKSLSISYSLPYFHVTPKSERFVIFLF
jgi:hypothetical protein